MSEPEHQPGASACRETGGLSRNRDIVAVTLLVISSLLTAVLVSPLAAALLVVTAGSEAFTITFRGARVSGSFAALVLAMATLGPLPAAAMAVAAAGFDGVVARRRPRAVVGNAVTYGAVALLGGQVLELADRQDPIAFAAAVVLVFLVANALSFCALVAQMHVWGLVSVRTAFSTVYRTMLPFELATALLTGGVAFCYERLGLLAIGLLAIVLLIFHHLARMGVAAYERGEELTHRTEELAALQVGVLSTVLQTLSLRDAMTARHSAAVARYSREVARMLGCDAREQDLIHTAALLHDIGKFILPDSVLFANRRLSDEEWELVKLHPESGAKLVERIEGYGPVAEIVLHHHERFEGGGYPAGIVGEAIPLGSRIIACADTYDVMTSRDSYRRPVSSEAALAELRRVSGTQLDPRVTAAFEQMIVAGAVGFSHDDEADFESELDTRSIKRDTAPADHQGELLSLPSRGNAVSQVS
jgi:putative nucleotidyltransferase with HDIG domain